MPLNRPRVSTMNLLQYGSQAVWDIMALVAGLMSLYSAPFDFRTISSSGSCVPEPESSG